MGEFANFRFDPEPAMDAWARAAQQRLHHALYRGADVAGMPLAPNAKGYRARKHKRGKPVGVLTGQMLAEILDMSNIEHAAPGHARVYAGPGGRESTIKLNVFLKGTNKPRAVTETFTSGRTGKQVIRRRTITTPIPRRDFVGVHEADIDAAADAMATDFFRQAGFR